MFKLFHLVIVAAFPLILHAQANVQKQLKPYVIISGPLRLNEVRVNIANYTPNSKNFSRSEISFGDGSAVSTRTDAYHTYASNGSFVITVKTWDTANILTTYSEIVDINPTFQIQDVANSSVFNIPKAIKGKPDVLNITAAQASKLYKLTLTKTPVSRVRRTFPPCGAGSNVSINGISVFKAGEFTCNIGQMQRFVVLSNSNTIQFETSESTAAFNFSIEIHEVTILKDTAIPLLSSNVPSNSLTRNNQVHISVADASATTTYVWNNSQQLLLSTTDKEFDLTLTEGANNFVLQSKDAFNNQSAYLYLMNIRLDTLPPVINALLLPEYIYNVYPQTVTISINSDEDLQALTINNIAATLLTPRTFSYLVTVYQPGTLNLSIKAFDLAGNETIKNYAPIFSIENTPPVISSSLATNSFTNQNSLQITVTDDSETNSEVYINNLLVLTTTEKIFDVTLLAGVNSILVKSKDSNNNEALNLSLNITYDIAPPVLSHNILPVYFASEFPAVLRVEFMTNEPLQSFETGSGLIVQPVNSIYKFNKQITGVGNQTVAIKATDLAGNVTNYVFNFVIKFDITVPSISFGAQPLITSEAAVPITVTISDLSETSTEIWVNNVLMGTTAQKNFIYTANLPSDGFYIFYFKVTDEAKNVSERTFTIEKRLDMVPPVLSHDIKTQYFAKQFPRNIKFLFQSDEPLKEFLIDNQPATSTALGYEFDKSVLSAGVHQISVKATDLSNNVFTTTYNFEVVLDVFPPQITLTNTPAVNFTNLNTFPFAVSIDDQSSVKTDILLNQILLTTVTEKNFSYSLSLPDDGVYNIVIISTDESGNTNTKNLMVTRDTRPLVVTILSPQAGSLYTSQLVEVRFTSNKAIKNAFVNNVAAPVNADLTSVTSNSVIWNEGLFLIVVRVEDQYGGVVESSVQAELKLGGSSSWSYEECPVE